MFEKLTILYTQVKSWIILWSGLHEQCKCKSKHMHERTLFYLKTPREMMTGFMFCVLALGLALHLHQTLFKCKCMNESKLKYFFLPSWDSGCPINCLCISLYACLCTRLCMNSLLALLFVWLMLPSLVYTESIYDAAIWKIASTLTFDGFMSSYQELRNQHDLCLHSTLEQTPSMQNSFFNCHFSTFTL